MSPMYKRGVCLGTADLNDDVFLGSNVINTVREYDLEVHPYYNCIIYNQSYVVIPIVVSNYSF